MADVEASGSPRRPTRAVVLELIRVGGPISRTELATATAMTPATMTTVVRDLITDGLVVEVGVGEPTGGKPRTLLQARPDSRYAIGIQLGFEAISYVIVNVWGELIAHRTSDGAGDAPPTDIVRRIAHEASHMVRDAGIERAIVAGVGIVVPGPIDRPLGAAVQLPSSLPWSDFGIRGALADELGMRVVMDNDATAAAAGEYWSRATGGTSSFATIHMAMGIGAGIMVGGELLRGVSGNAGEIGHTPVDFDGPLCHCGARGCLELFAAPAAIEESYAAESATALPWREIAARAVAGTDPVAMRMVQRASDALAVATRGLVNLLDLELVVLTGEGFGPAAGVFAARIQEVLDATFFARRSHRVRVVASSDPDRAAALGGAALVLRENLTR